MKYLLVGLCCLTISGCSFFYNKVKEYPRYGEDAVVYECASNQNFGLKILNQGQEAWLMLPDHEIGLSRSEVDKNRYHAGAIELHLNGNKTSLDDANHLHYSECKPKETSQ